MAPREGRSALSFTSFILLSLATFTSAVGAKPDTEVKDRCPHQKSDLVALQLVDRSTGHAEKKRIWLPRRLNAWSSNDSIAIDARTATAAENIVAEILQQSVSSTSIRTEASKEPDYFFVRFLLYYSPPGGGTRLKKDYVERKSEGRDVGSIVERAGEPYASGSFATDRPGGQMVGKIYSDNGLTVSVSSTANLRQFAPHLTLSMISEVALRILAIAEFCAND